MSAPFRVSRLWYSFAKAVSGARTMAPGIALTGAIAAGCYLIGLLPIIDRISPLILATIIGMLIKNTIGTVGPLKPGIQFSGRTLLRAAIVLLGLRLTGQDLLAIDPAAVLVVFIAVVSTMIFTFWMGRLLQVDAKLTQLIGMGTAICGASAIAAANGITGANGEKVTLALIVITLFGTIAMLAYPLIGSLIGLDPRLFGIWSGASIHEVAQVVGTAYQGGIEAGEIGTLVKLGRVVLLAPAIVALGIFAVGGTKSFSNGRRVHLVPGFVLLFLVVIGVNTVLPVSLEAREFGTTLSTTFMIMALAALGLGADFRKLTLEGLMPLVLGGLSTLYISVTTLVLLVVLI